MKGDGREICKGESDNNQNEFCIYSKLSKKKLNKSYIKDTLRFSSMSKVFSMNTSIL